MAPVARSTSTTVVEVPQNLEGLLADLKEAYPRDIPLLICTALHNIGDPTAGMTCYNEKMRAAATQIYETLKQAANSGKTSYSFTFFPDCDVPMTSAILKIFQEKMSLEGYEPGCHHFHSQFCYVSKAKGASVKICLTWKPINNYLDPKPSISLPNPRLEGPALLNEERHAGRGDCHVDFGHARFAAHRLLVGSFSPVLKMLVESDPQVQASGIVLLPQMNNVSREALEAFMSFMYLREIDFSKLPRLDVIRLLEHSHFLDSETLKTKTFEYLYNRGIELTNQEILPLCFLQTEQPFAELNELCQWLLKKKPKFYEAVLAAEVVPAEDLMMLFGVSRYFDKPLIKDRLASEWQEMTTAQKVAFAQVAMTKKGNLSLLQEIQKMCDGDLDKLTKHDPDGDSLAQACSELYQRITELRSRRSLPKK